MSDKDHVFRVTSLVVLGNILEYYDFLLFAHIGPVITPLFFPGLSTKSSHILSLLLFGLSFVIRPIGGFIFGRISDLKGRKTSLIQSVKWAVFPAIGLACLPTYETLGVVATALFVLLRLFQGFALGGEYPTAGTYLMEYHKNHRGLISGILGCSGTVGSLVGFSFAWQCLQENSPPWLWRAGFFFGGMACFLSVFMRRFLVEHPLISASSHPRTLADPQPRREWYKWLVVFMIGVIVGTTVWLPTTYSNFYVTKVLGFSVNQGLITTLVALLGHILFLPLFGAISDRYGHFRVMFLTMVCTVPIGILSFWALSRGDIVVAQLGLIALPSGLASIHVVMNALFPIRTRGRSVGLLFMSGLSIGGLAPSFAGYLVMQTGFQFIPAILVSGIACITALTFYKAKKEVSQSDDVRSSLSPALEGSYV